jgi:hypothetical protein
MMKNDLKITVIKGQDHIEDKHDQAKRKKKKEGIETF